MNPEPEVETEEETEPPPHFTLEVQSVVVKVAAADVVAAPDVED